MGILLQGGLKRGSGGLNRARLSGGGYNDYGLGRGRFCFCDDGHTARDEENQNTTKNKKPCDRSTFHQTIPPWIFE